MYKVLLCASVAAFVVACSGETEQWSGVRLAATDFTYTLSESSGDLLLWTTPATHGLRADEGPPDFERSGLSLSAARNEFEPVQLILGPGKGEVKVTWEDFPSLGSQQRVEAAKADFTDAWNVLEPLPRGDAVERSEDHSVAVWITVYVPSDAPAGEHLTTVSVERGDQSVQVPLRLYVFDFELPVTGHFHTRLGMNDADAFFSGGIENDIVWFFEHRITPDSFIAPAMFGPGANWDTTSSSSTCEVFFDDHEYISPSLAHQLRKYLAGEGWLGDGFPSALLPMFRTGDEPRPLEFCGMELDDPSGSEEYNAEWSQYLAATEQFLQGEGVLEKTSIPIFADPRDEEDYGLAAHLCRLSKDAAPGLRIAIQHGPGPEIAEHASGPCGYDLWIARASEYDKDYAWERQRDFGEEVWLRSTYDDPYPASDGEHVDGMNQRILSWVSWTMRISGWADDNEYSEIENDYSAEMLREGFEDYEYLYLANNVAGGGSYPQVFQEGTADATAESVAGSLTDWTHDVDALMALRHQLGLFIEGSLSEPPVLITGAD